MRRPYNVEIAMKRTISSLALAALLASVVAAQAPSNYTPLKTPWGDPDLQGKWPGIELVGVPMQRAANLGTRNVLTEEEFKQQQERFARQAAQDEADFDLDAATSTPGGDVGGPVSPPPHWLERGKPQHIASLIVDPPDGRMPPLTPEAQQRNQAALAARKSSGRGPADSYTDRSLYDRCISRGVIGSVLPVIYNNGNEIVQAPGYVVIRNEMIHESRIVPLDGRPHLNSGLHLWMGDSRGHWEGDTLIVETRNLTDRTGISQGGNNPHSDQLVITERFRLIDANTLQYEATLNDPQTWTKPWTISFPWKRDSNYLMFEYSCHEGNYAMRNLLSGARAEEQANNKSR